MLRTLFFVLLSVTAFGQNQGNQWVFPNSNTLDFSTVPPTFISGGALACSGATFCEGVASISDSNGNLLFYSDGTKIWDSNDAVVTNGDGLLGNRSSTNSAYIVPVPASDTRYYVFTTDGYENQLENGLRYNVVEVCSKSEISVIEKNVLLRNNVTEKLSATRKNNGVDYWLMAHEHGTDRFLSYSITDAGIEFADSNSIGVQHPTAFNGSVGQMKFSPNSSKLALVISNNGLNPLVEILDFDNGNLSNPISFSPDTIYSGQDAFLLPCYGISFSPNSALLYVAPVADNRLFQLDVSSYQTGADIVESKYLLSNQWNVGEAFHQMQLGPDGKIYLARNTIGYLGVVNNPNEIGSACNFDIQGVNLEGNTSGWGLPAFIDSYDYTATGICAPNVINEEGKNQLKINAFPNPSSGQVRIEFADILENGTLLTYNTQGSLVDRKNLGNTNAVVYELPKDKGVYLLRLLDSHGNQGSLTVLKE